MAALTTVAAAAQARLLIAAGFPLFSAQSLDQAFPIITLAVVAGAVVGAVIVDRHPGHRIGWLFCIGQAGTAVGLASQALAVGVLAHGFNLPLSVGHLAAWVGRLFGAGYALTLLGCLLLLVPDGRLPSRRWRPVLALLAGGYATEAVGLLLVSPRQIGPTGPIGVGLVPAIIELVGELAISVGLVGAAVALVVRLRRARGEERQQLRWIAVAAFALAVALTIMVADNILRGGNGHWYFVVLFYAGYLAVPVATGVAVLRYRLYQIDVIIGSAVRLAVLGTFVTVGYVAVVVAVGAVIGGSSDPESSADQGSIFGQWPSLLAYVLVALAFQPLRRFVNQLADRVVYGARAAPYESLGSFARQLGAHLSEREMLLLVAQCCARAVGAAGGWATVSVADGEDLTENWPDSGSTANRVSLEVRSGTTTLGEIGVRLAAGRSLSKGDRQLLREFADRAVPAFRNVALAAALRARADALSRQGAELASSRRRLAVAADTERELVAAAIRSQVMVHLVELERALPGIDPMHDAAAARSGLIQMQEQVNRAIEALRAITGGVLPPLLARHGLPAALQTYAGRSARRPRVVVADGDGDRRFDSSIEAAAYFYCVWTVEALAPHSQVRLHFGAAQLQVSVQGNLSAGLQLAEQLGWQQVVDRLEAVGGQVLTSGSESGDDSVLVSACIPILLLPSAVAADQSALRLSGPKADLSR